MATLRTIPAVLLAIGLCGASLAAVPGPTTVSFGEYFYRPSNVTVRVGQPVVFVNAGKITHTVADTNTKGVITSRVIKPRPLDAGQRQRVTFSRPGFYRYLCTFHPTLMKGTVTVTK
jgi:plastocyanin